MKRSTWVVMVLLALLIGGIAAWATASRPDGTTTTTTSAATTTTTLSAPVTTTGSSAPPPTTTSTTIPTGATTTTAPGTTTTGATTTTKPPATTTTVTAPPGNHAPTVTITAPTAGKKFWASKQYPFGATITFTAEAADEDGDAFTVEWFVTEPYGHSNQGLLGTGASISGTIYVQGADSAQPFITARVTDQWGATSEHTIQIIVSIPSDT